MIVFGRIFLRYVYLTGDTYPGNTYFFQDSEQLQASVEGNRSGKTMMNYDQRSWKKM